MEVTQRNFETTLPEVLKAVSTCDFLAFDCEFTGFGLGGLAILPYDTPALVYDKTKGNIGNHTVMQFGLATFSYHAPSMSFRYRVFNFYVFPRLPKSLQRLRAVVQDQFTYSSQADCMDFLASKNFDFNKWIVDGVGYLREAEVNKLAGELKRRYTWRMKSGRTETPGESKPAGKSKLKIPEHAAAKVKEATERIKAFMADPDQNEIILHDVNVHERRLLFQIIENEYFTSIFAYGVRQDDGANDIRLKKCKDAEDHDRMQQEKLDAEVKELQDAAGFCKVINAITLSRKPILGHNLFTDLLHVIRAFCCPLPEDYGRFKALIQQRFKKLIDTKVLAGQNPLKSIAGWGMSLFDLQRKVAKAPFVQVLVEPEDPSYGYTVSKENLHEAGYDAFVTGCIFIHLANHLGNQKAPSRPSRDIPWDLIVSVMGKIMPGRIVDMPYLSLNTPDLSPDRRHVFHISFASDGKSWTNYEIMPLFSPFGQVFINWIDDRSAFVCLKSRDQAPLVKKAMIDGRASVENSGWRLRFATDYLNEMEERMSSRMREAEEEEEHRVEPMQTDEPWSNDDTGDNGALKRVRCS